MVGALEAEGVRCGAINALFRVVNLSVVLASVTAFIAKGAVLVGRAIRSVVKVTLRFAFAPGVAAVQHEVLQQDVIGVLPAGRAVETVTLKAASAWVVTVQDGNHDVDSSILDILLILIRVSHQVETVVIISAVIFRVHHILQHDRDFR